MVKNRQTDCGFLGLWASYRAARAEVWQVVCRDIALLVALSLGFSLPSGRFSRSERVESSGSVVRSGFTLIELMVVIVVVAILAAIAMPAIFRGKNAALAASAKSRIRQHAAVFNAYATDSKGVLPYFAHPADKTLLTDQMSGRQLEIKYFNMMYAWPFVLAGPYYQRPVYDQVFVEPGLDHQQDRPLFSYLYPCSFVADASYWNPKTRIESRKLWNPSRIDQIRFPSGKSLVVQSPDPASKTVPTPGDADVPLLAFTDGSAAVAGPEAPDLQCRLGDGWFPDASAADGHTGYGVVGLHTLDGVEGRDRR